jgi:hypothetical protein
LNESLKSCHHRCKAHEVSESYIFDHDPPQTVRKKEDRSTLSLSQS